MGRAWLLPAAALLPAAQAAPVESVAGAPTGRTVADIELSTGFGLPAGWHLVATQDPPIPDPTGVGGGSVPGAIHLCLRQTDAGDCSPALSTTLRAPVSPDDYYTEPHFLNRAALVYPRGRVSAPLLLVQDASLHSVDGGQVVTTQLIAAREHDARFIRVFRQDTGTNNNQEIRYIDAGPLRGAVISAEPAQHAPFGYWITVDRLTPAYSYRRAVRFLSATRYGDGNPLAVIDSEMPAIQRRLGLWRPGQPLPLPAAPCPRAHLRRGALWCR